ncbi:hypothetical protein YC2023_090458 [Brassica napus]
MFSGSFPAIFARWWALVPAHDGIFCMMWLASGSGGSRSSRRSFRLLAPISFLSALTPRESGVGLHYCLKLPRRFLSLDVLFRCVWWMFGDLLRGRFPRRGDVSCLACTCPFLASAFNAWQALETDSGFFWARVWYGPS